MQKVFKNGLRGLEANQGQNYYRKQGVGIQTILQHKALGHHFSTIHWANQIWKRHAFAPIQNSQSGYQNSPKSFWKWLYVNTKNMILQN